MSLTSPLLWYTILLIINFFLFFWKWNKKLFFTYNMRRFILSVIIRNLFVFSVLWYRCNNAKFFFLFCNWIWLLLTPIFCDLVNRGLFYERKTRIESNLLMWEPLLRHPDAHIRQYRLNIDSRRFSLNFRGNHLTFPAFWGKERNRKSTGTR